METPKDTLIDTSAGVSAPTEPTPTETVAAVTPIPSVVTPAGIAWYRRPIVIAILVALVLLGGAGWYLYTNNYKNGGVVATVNGTPIYRAVYEESARLITESAVGQGLDVTSEEIRTTIQNEAINTLIDNALLTEAAQTNGIVVSPEEAQGVYDKLLADVGGPEALAARMVQIGITEEKLRANIEERILVDSYIESVTDIETLTVTDEEVQAFITANVPEGTELPPLEEIRPIIETEILQSKQQAIVVGLLESLRKDAKIEIRL